MTRELLMLRCVIEEQDFNLKCRTETHVNMFQNEIFFGKILFTFVIAIFVVNTDRSTQQQQIAQPTHSAKANRHASYRQQVVAGLRVEQGTQIVPL